MKKIMKYLMVKIVLPLIYMFFKCFPKDEKLVVFADIRDRDMPDNLKEMHQMCVEKGYHCKVLLGRKINQKCNIIKKGLLLVQYCLEFISAYARCRALFLIEYFPLTDILAPRKGVEVVQLWHGCGAMKVMGYAAKGKSWINNEAELEKYPVHRNYTLVSVSSEAVIPCYESAFKTNTGVVKALGVPRTDIYFNQEVLEMTRKKVFELFPQIQGRKILLFAPTFRGHSLNEAHYDIELDIDLLREKLGHEYVLMTKYHPLMKTGSYHEENSDFMLDVTKLLSPEEALSVADILVGDYSSIMFEYLLLRKPMISFIPDIEEYIGDRGFFFPYEETMPGPYVKTQSELIDAILNVESWYNKKHNEVYLKKFMSACDGHSTERIFTEVFKER